MLLEVTGKPGGDGGGAMVSVAVAATQDWFHFGAGRLDDVPSYAFDFSVWEIWGALLYGGRLVVVPLRGPRAGGFLALGRERVTVLTQTPTAFYVTDRGGRGEAPA